MIPTTRSDDMGDLVAFVRALPWSHDRVRATTRGASEADIARFEALARYPLPKLYRTWLTQAGEDDGGLGLADDASMSLQRLLAFYESQADVDYWDTPFLGVVVALPGLTGARALIYDEEMRDEPSVVVSWGDRVSHTLAESARNWMYQQSFARFRFGATRRVFMHAPDGQHPGLDAVAGLLAAEGLKPYWFSDRYTHCAEGDGACAHLSAQRDRLEVIVEAHRHGASIERRLASVGFRAPTGRAG